MTSKINMDGKIEEISLELPIEEIETNDEDIYKTIDLNDILDEVNEQV